MSDLINREEIERRLARLLSKGLQTELDKLLGYLGDPPDLGRVPFEYWQNGWRSIQKDIEPVLVETFVQQAGSMLDQVGIGVDWAQVNSVAANWASRHSEETLLQMFQKTYANVGENVAEYYKQGWNFRQLRERLISSDYSPRRAQMIAVTEAGRAAVEGERAMVKELASVTGKEMIPVWMTANDELARRCPICGNRHLQIIKNGQFPPAHPNCRCSVAWDWPELVNKADM